MLKIKAVLTKRPQQTLATTIDADRNWKGERSDGNFFDDHDQGKADELDECEQMDPARLDVAKVDAVGLVLDRHRQHIQTLYELQTYTTYRAGFSLGGALFGKYVGPFPALIPLPSCPTTFTHKVVIIDM